MAILLIRHGETPLNAARIVQFPDTPLSERGREQADRLARRLAAHPVRAILASDYRRARMTAEAVARETGAPIDFTATLRERNFGTLRGQSHDEIGAEMLSPDLEPPEGESLPVFFGRVASAWDEATAFAEKVEGDTAVVSHGLVCRAVIERHVGFASGIEPADALWENTALTILEPGNGREPWQVVRLACAKHLHD